MSADAALQGLLDDLGLGIDLSETAIDEGAARTDESDTGITTVEAVIVEPYPYGDGRNEDRTVSRFDPETGTQVAITVKHRPECPSCGHVVANPDEPNNLAGECIDCGTQTCPQCRAECSACGTLLCNHHTSGHGAQTQVYCAACKQEAAAQVEHQRALDHEDNAYRRWSEHLQHDRAVQKQAEELRLQETMRERELDLQQQHQEFQHWLDEQRHAVTEWVQTAERQLQDERLRLEREAHEKDLELKDEDRKLKRQERRLKALQEELDRQSQEFDQRLKEHDLALKERRLEAELQAEAEVRGWRQVAEERELRIQEWKVILQLLAVRARTDPTPDVVEVDSDTYETYRALPADYPAPDKGLGRTIG